MGTMGRMMISRMQMRGGKYESEVVVGKTGSPQYEQNHPKKNKKKEKKSKQYFWGGNVVTNQHHATNKTIVLTIFRLISTVH